MSLLISVQRDKNRVFDEFKKKKKSKTEIIRYEN